MRREYSARERRLADSDIYSHFNTANLFILQQRQREVLALLRRQGFAHLAELLILELGCGRGGVLLEYLTFGAYSPMLNGTDLLSDRALEAHKVLPHLPLTCSDGQNLPYKGETFDLLLQYTVFTSILDDHIKSNLAAEMLRITKPEGIILWYDYWLNPTNPHAHGIRPAEIRRLFPGCRFVFRRITLAPPIARLLVPLSWVVSVLLEKMRIFNTHYLVAIRPDH